MNIQEHISKFTESLPVGVTLVAVSKTYPAEAVMEAYKAGQRIFGENRPQEMVAKSNLLPADIRWHMIGNLQTNKVKYIAPFVDMIHSVDSEKLLGVIDKEAQKNRRIIDVLMEVFIAEEQNKIGWDIDELTTFLRNNKHLQFNNIRIRGLMGMATFTDDQEQIRREFLRLKSLFDLYRKEFFNEPNIVFDTLSMGMSSDWQIALECGSNMIRIGSAIFGERRK